MVEAKKKKQNAAVKPVKKTEPVKNTPKTQSVSLFRLYRIPALIIILITVAVNFNTLFLDYALDDSLLITGNTLTKKGFSAIPEILSSDVFQGYFGKGGIEAGGRYRPLSQTVFAIQYGLFGEKPFIGHLTNVLLYALTCLILYYFLIILFPPGGKQKYYLTLPFIATLLYALHPLHAEAVANIKSLDEILAMLFSLLTALFILLSDGKKRITHLILSFISFLLALLAKENAITFLAVVPLAMYYKTKNIKSAVISLIPIAVATILYFIFRKAALGSMQQIPPVDNFLTNPFFGGGMMGRIATVFYIALRYLWLMIFPYPLTTDYYPAMIPVTSFANPLVWLSLLIFGVSAVLAVIRLKQRGVLAFGIIYFFLTYSVVSNLLINLGTPMNDRFLFMPSMGFMLLVAWLLLEKTPQLIKRGNIKKTVSVVLVIIMAGYSIQTISRNANWKDDYTLLTHDILISPKSARCNVMTGKIVYEKAQQMNPVQKEEYYKRAEQYLKKGLSIYDGYYLAWGLLGIIQMDRNNNLIAARHFIRCLKILPDLSVALANLSICGKRMLMDGDTNGAAYAFKNLKAIQPENPEPYQELVAIYSKSNKIDSAMIILDELVANNPKNAEAYLLKADICIQKLNDPGKAETYLIKALELDPKNVTVAGNLGSIAYQRKDYKLALSYFFKALELSPGSAHYLSNIASTYSIMGDKDNAEKYYKLYKESEQKGIK
jgi:protein O-mannosyl-transferase